MWYNNGNKLEGIEGKLEKLKQALKEIEGANINIHMRHKLFGNDYIKCDKFIPVIENGVGFHTGDQTIYIKYDEINSYEIKKHKIIINGKNRCIEMIKRD